MRCVDLVPPARPLQRDVLAAADAAVSLEEGLRAALARICAHTGWEAGRVELSSEAGEVASRIVWHLDAPEHLPRFRHLAKTHGAGLANQVLKDGERTSSPLGAGKLATFAFPAVGRSRTLAALEFFSTDDTPPDDALLDGIAQACAELGELIETKPDERSLRHVERGYRDLFESVRDALVVVDPATFVVAEVNPRASELYGVSRAALLGARIDALWDDTELARAAIERGGRFEAVQRRPDGTEVLLEVSASAVRYHGRPAALLVTREVTRRVRVIEALRASEQRYRVLFENSPQPMWVEDLEQGRFLAVNDAAVHHYGFSPQRFLQMTAKDLFADEPWSAESRSGSAAMRRHITSRGEVCDIEISSHEIEFEGRRARLVAATDVTARRKAQARLLQAAFYDPLTGLANRALFKDRLEVAFSRGKGRDGLRYAVLFLDLDRFKLVNDSLGHRAGDELLVQIGRRLESCRRAGDTVARLGGDEFTLLVENVATDDEAIRVAERVHSAMAKPFVVGGHEVFAAVSIGIALGGPETEQPEHLLRDADTAMYRAKVRGTRHALFDASMHERVMAALRLENELRRALERGELRVHYQPIVSLESGRPSTGVWAGSAARGGRIVSVEALVRWQHRERGLVPPAEFVALAEETGLIVPLGRWVLEEACKGVLTLPGDVGLSVNLSGRQLLQPDLVEQLSCVLKSTGIEPGRLRLELTESMLIGSGATAVEGLERLRALGVQLCIDDFGTGYSSLSYLHQLPIDALKIDRSFVKAMSADDRKIKIVQSILMLGKGLGIEVIAEGVETEEQAATLRRLGCARAQGYLFARPLPLADVARLLEVR